MRSQGSRRKEYDSDATDVIQVNSVAPRMNLFVIQT